MKNLIKTVVSLGVALIATQVVANLQFNDITDVSSKLSIDSRTFSIKETFA
ncbi:hypothetical protein THERMOT_1897 [Bathymodiolus thermophilus thioautotrophic gill symbiont]|uniref:hypothetical protein n=1 Tax=Bathymodiolus thermophilus thioautotrophic gill symbiont TaxID=2360 RepID=UPI001A2D264F|nr:hypothetical protein [Bathymodiolus thermophilus thioautotrophic gill symbiont]CAB5504046.1 hypothetical protein THERMOT_1897 [Bathymodiolus thermophilus thioautotrophic gill symbiont]